MSILKDVGGDANTGAVSGYEASAMAVEPDRVRVRYVGPPSQGVHPTVGGVTAGGVYEVHAGDVERMLGERFERAE